MKWIDFVILVIVLLIVGLVIRQIFKQNKKGGACSSCEHAHPKWIKDYKRKI